MVKIAALNHNVHGFMIYVKLSLCETACNSAGIPCRKLVSLSWPLSYIYLVHPAMAAICNSILKFDPSNLFADGAPYIDRRQPIWAGVDSLPFADFVCFVLLAFVDCNKDVRDSKKV